MEAKVPTAKVRWKESEVMRMIRAGKKVGVPLAVEVMPDGTLRGVPVTAAVTTGAELNPFEVEADRLRRRA
jgi:hypothetical protein